MHKILVIRLYFPLYAVHVSDCISPSLGAILYKFYVAVWYMPTYTGIYHMRCTAYKVAPDDGLIQFETCRAYIENKV